METVGLRKTSSWLPYAQDCVHKLNSFFDLKKAEILENSLNFLYVIRKKCYNLKLTFSLHLFLKDAY